MPPTILDADAMPAPTMFRLGGHRYWRFLDGTVLPVLSGGADGDGGEGNDDDDADGDDAGSDDDDDDDKGRAGGPKARMRDLKRERDRRKAAETEKAELEKRLKKLEGAQRTDAEKALDKAKEEATEAARKEAAAENALVLAKANERVLRAEAKVIAIAQGVKPDRVDKFLRLIDLDDIDMDDDGDFDAKEIRTLVKKELEGMPEFKADAGSGNGKNKPNGKGGFDGGARRDEGKSALDTGRERARARFGTGSKD